jgi:DNA polymerase delta subunit 3
MPEPEEPAEELQETTILLVREEELKSTSYQIRCKSACADWVAETRAEFEEVTSIHIYSLEPGPIEVRDGYSAVTNMAAKQCRIWACSRHATTKP